MLLLERLGRRLLCLAQLRHRRLLRARSCSSASRFAAVARSAASCHRKRCRGLRRAAPRVLLHSRQLLCVQSGRRRRPAPASSALRAASAAFASIPVASAASARSQRCRLFTRQQPPLRLLTCCSPAACLSQGSRARLCRLQRGCLCHRKLALRSFSRACHSAAACAAARRRRLCAVRRALRLRLAGRRGHALLECRCLRRVLRASRLQRGPRLSRRAFRRLLLGRARPALAASTILLPLPCGRARRPRRRRAPPAAPS